MLKTRYYKCENGREYFGPGSVLIVLTHNKRLAYFLYNVLGLGFVRETLYVGFLLIRLINFYYELVKNMDKHETKLNLMKSLSLVSH